MHNKDIRKKKLALERSINKYIIKNLNKNDCNYYYNKDHVNSFVNKWLAQMKKSDNNYFIYKSLRGITFELDEYYLDFVFELFNKRILNLIEKWNMCKYDSSVTLNGDEISNRQIYKYRELYKLLNEQPLKLTDTELRALYTKTDLSNEIDDIQAIIRNEHMEIPATDKQKKYIKRLYKKLDIFSDVDNISKENAKLLIADLLKKIEEIKVDEIESIPEEGKIISISNYF